MMHEVSAETKIKIFLSHSSEDAYLAEIFRDLLQAALPLTNEDIRVTSLPGSNVAPGKELAAELRREVVSSPAFVALVSPSALRSPYVLLELGARWGAEGHMVLLQLPDADMTSVPIGVLKWETPTTSSLGDLLISVAQRIGEQVRNPMAYDAALGKFIDAVARRPPPISTPGFTTTAVMSAHRHRLPGEVYAIEILTEPVTLSRDGNLTSVTVDRSHVNDVVFSNEGKMKLYRDHVQGNEERIWEQDERVQRYLLGTTSALRVPAMANPPELRLPLRWASGGVLSIVTYRRPEDDRERKWVPLLFRDIRPYGWNLPLGSAERWFTKDGDLDARYQSLEIELNKPDNYINREFIEEILVIGGEPAKDKKLVHRGFTFPGADHPMDEFAVRHRECRSALDGLDIQPCSFAGRIFVKPQHTSTNVLIHDRTGIGHGATDMLVAFSLTDLGIEVVKVLEYSLASTDYLLDGEILRVDKDESPDALVRMPIALMSYDYLESVFGGAPPSWVRTEGPAPSFDIGSSVPQEDVRLFEWDIERRLEIIRGHKRPHNAELQRHLDWYDKFGACFLDDQRQVTRAHLPSLFVPATARLLNSYFTGRLRGQVTTGV